MQPTALRQPAFMDWADRGFSSELVLISPHDCPDPRSPGKRPMLSGWRSMVVRPPDVRRWAKQHANVGLRTERFPAFDLDVDDGDVVDALEFTIRDVLGDAPCRYRSNSPRRTLLYRLAGDPFTKEKIRFTLPDGTDGAVELLASGQQTVVAGIHPTGATLEWSPELPVASDLPPINATQRNEVLNQLHARLITLGCKVEREEPPVQRKPKPAGAVSGRLEEAVRSYNQANGRSLPRNSSDCPICGDQKSFGHLPDDPARWYCFSSDHPSTAGVRGSAGYHGDFLDLDSYAAGMGRMDFLRAHGYLPQLSIVQPSQAGSTSTTAPSEPVVEKVKPVPVRLSIDSIRSPPREEFVLGSLIPLGKSSVVFGPTSVGKSALMSQLAFAVAAGAESLWGLPLIPGGGPVLIYSAEDTIDDWKRKGGAVLNGHGDDFDWEKALERFFVIDHSEGLARLSEVVTVRSGPAGESVSQRVARPTEEQDRLIDSAKSIGAKFILVETASRLVEDEDNANFSALQSSLGRIGRETGAAVVVSHHATKAASKENDSAIESARGGGALIFNARNALSLFPADSDTVKSFEGRFPADDIVTLFHGKPTSSSRRNPPITLIRCDAVHGAVFRLPEDVVYTADQEARVRGRLEAAQAAKLDQIRRLYRLVEEALPTRPTISPTYLRELCPKEMGVSKHRVEKLIQAALECGALRVKTRTERGITLALGIDPSNPIQSEE